MDKFMAFFSIVAHKMIKKSVLYIALKRSINKINIKNTIIKI
jgi:hypothetical protein